MRITFRYAKREDISLIYSFIMRLAEYENMAEIAIERDCVRLEWLCLRDNQPSVGFYQHMGARLTDECVVFRATGDDLKEMIKK